MIVRKKPHPLPLPVPPLPMGEGLLYQTKHLVDLAQNHTAGPSTISGKPVASQGNKQRMMMATTIQST